jgi:hypothetical protein
VPDSQKTLRNGFGGVYAHNILLNLARSGTPDETESVSSLFAERYLALDEVSNFQGNLDLVSAWRKAGLQKSSPVDSIVPLSYAGLQLRRQGDWSLAVTGISKNFYHTQYEREGFLFACIGGLSLVEKGKLHSMWSNASNTMLNGRHDPKMLWMTAGYHPSFSPCVTAVQSEWKDLGQRYYQKGSDTFVGGVTLSNHFGIFVQRFDARNNPETYGKSSAKALRFRKSYFIFDRRVVALGRSIGANAEDQLTTGLLQERGEKSIELGSPKISWKDLSRTVKSEELSWAQTVDHSLGVWIFPNQTLRGESGNLEAGSRSGQMSRLYIEHGTEVTDAMGRYQSIYIVKPQADELARFDSKMRSSQSPVLIQRDDEQVQMVSDADCKTTGYVFWEGARLSDGLLLSASVPCTVLITELSSGRLQLAVSDPDLHTERIDKNPFGYSLPTTVELALRGRWMIKNSKPTGSGKTTIANGTESTVMTVQVQDGLSAEIVLDSK